MISKSSSNLPEPLTVEQQKHQFEQERMHDVELLLDNLFRREEVTLKLVINYLYDVGSVNLINQKVPVRFVSGIIQYIAKLSKPAFRCLALYWVKKNCPELITNWLHRKISFEPYVLPEPTIVEVADQAHDVVQNAVLDDADRPLQMSQDALIQDVREAVLPESVVTSMTAQTLEIQALRRQVSVLAGTTIAAIAVLGGTITYISYRLDISPLQLLQLPKTTAVDQPTDCVSPRQSAQSPTQVIEETSTSPAP